GYKKISDITIERNKRVIEKMLTESDESDSESPKLGFKDFKLQKSNFPRTAFAPDPEKTDEENIAALDAYIAEEEAQQKFDFNLPDLLTEILIKQGFNLNFTYSEVPEFTENTVFRAEDCDKHALICLDAEIK